MPNSMTPHDRVMTALRGGRADRVPFTAYENKLPQCTAERALRNRGLCVVYRMESYRTVTPNVKTVSLSYTDETGRSLVRTTHSTPAGELSMLAEQACFTSWIHERWFKTPSDYKALQYLLKDTIYLPRYDATAAKAAALGHDFMVRDQIPSEPLQQLISTYMGTEAFCYEWMDNRDEVLKLYDIILENNRKAYVVVADGPLEFANYGGNVTPCVIGAETFRRYYAPNYDEAAEVLHRKGKLVGCHLDADNTLIMADVAATALDYVEAYDPGISPPVEEARKCWPGKSLWINYPSAWQLCDEDTVRERTELLIEEAGDGEGFLIGITEDVPEDRWQGNFSAILDGIERSGDRDL